MSVVLNDIRPSMSMTSRLIMLVGAIVLGFAAGILWPTWLSTWAYEGLVGLYASPDFQITSQAVGIGLAFILGLVHVTSICYLPAALTALPMVQTVQSNRDWLKTVGALALSMIVVAALLGVAISAPANLLAGFVGSRHLMSQTMQATIVVVGVLLIIVAMGELGLIRRVLPFAHIQPAPADSADALADMSPRARYRRAAWMGVWMAATFGLMCPKPLYVALLVYVAVLGSPVYGALALGTYGLGLATSVAAGGLVLLRTNGTTCITRWLGAREEAFHVVQGIVFAAAGAKALAFFWLVYVVVPA